MRKLLLSIFLLLSTQLVVAAFKPAIELNILTGPIMCDDELYLSIGAKCETSLLRWEVGKKHIAHASLALTIHPRTTNCDRTFIQNRTSLELAAGYGYRLDEVNQLSISLFWGYCHYPRIFAGELMGGSEVEYCRYINGNLAITFPINITIMSQELGIKGGIGIRAIIL